MKTTIYTLAIAACGLMAPHAAAQKYTLKAYGDVGLGNAMSLTTTLPGMTAKSSANSFGVDFGWTFWSKNSHSLEANIGLGYSMASAKFNLPQFSYNYAAPASADEDGNAYQRYVTLSDMQQKVNLGYIRIPVYLQYKYRAVEWLGLYAEAGVGLGFKCAGKIDDTTGTADAYGVYSEFDNLVIDDAYMNDFGTTNLADAAKGSADFKGFCGSVIAGAGFEFYVNNHISFDLGVRYNAGMNGLFGGGYGSTAITAETAPVVYDAAVGQTVRTLSNYTTKSRLSSLALRLAFNYTF